MSINLKIYSLLHIFESKNSSDQRKLYLNLKRSQVNPIKNHEILFATFDLLKISVKTLKMFVKTFKFVLSYG